MISYVYEESVGKGMRRTADAQKKKYGAVHAIITHLLKKSPRSLRSSYDISIVCIGEKKMRELYAAYKGKDRVTDVLSFFYGKGEGDPRSEGEIFVCIPQALRQARRHHISLAREMMRLVIHGFLHIYGYDHQKKDERMVMRSLEKNILRICKKKGIQ